MSDSKRRPKLDIERTFSAKESTEIPPGDMEICGPVVREESSDMGMNLCYCVFDYFVVISTSSNSKTTSGPPINEGKSVHFVIVYLSKIY